MKYPYDFINQIICGDCLEVMKTMPDNCIDTIITDPPYGLEFMGKDWDKFGGKPIDRSKENSSLGIHRYFKGNKPIYNWDMSEYYKFVLNWAIEALRVTKPGATLLCFGGTRTYHRLACAIEDAGWILKDCIMWLYGSGFPKATDISQTLDKNECRKQLEKKLNRKPTQGEFKKEWGGFRKIVGKKECGYQVSISKIRKEQGYRPNLTNATRKVDITATATPEATLWNGWKSHGLKPAYEPILVAMKPNEGSYANNALKWGMAGLNIDGGRIGHNEPLKETNRQKNMGNSWDKNNCGLRNNPNNIASANQKGRYPTNVILDEESANMLDEQAPKTGAFAKVKSGHSGKSKGIYHDYAQRGDDGETFYADGLQGASRFFYCAKASKAERNRGCGGLEKKQTTGGGGGIGNYLDDVNSASGKYGSEKAPAKNNHPTVKPLSLMKYLCTLTNTPTGGMMLDPFCGSGTTLMACKELKRNYIGIDNVIEYCKIARERVNAIPKPLF